MTFRRLLPALAVAAGLAAGPAHAAFITYTAVGQSSTVYVSTTSGANVSATLTAALTGFNSTTRTATFRFTVDNTSAFGGAFLNQILLDASPNITSASVTKVSGSINWFGTTTQLPNASGISWDTCLFTGSNCSGGGSTNRFYDASGVSVFDAVFKFGGTTSLPPISFDNLRFKFQNTALGSSYEINCPVTSGRDRCALTPPPPKVPEPATLALLGAGLLGIAAVRRRQSR